MNCLNVNLVRDYLISQQRGEQPVEKDSKLSGMVRDSLNARPMDPSKVDLFYREMIVWLEQQSPDREISDEVLVNKMRCIACSALKVGGDGNALPLFFKQALDELFSCKPNQLTEQYLTFIQKNTGQHIHLENGLLKFRISTMADGVEEFLGCISLLDEVMRSKIEICLEPSKKVDVNIFFEKYGKFANSLSLMDNIESDDHFERLLSQCSNISTLYIRSDEIKEIRELPQLQSLTILFCWSKSLQSIPAFPNLTELKCDWCESLRAIPEIPSLTNLSCQKCYSVQSIPVLPHLEYLNCSECESLRAIPEFPNLTTLCCFGCFSLQAIPELPRLTSLWCSGCSSLRWIPALPNLITVSCVDCKFNLISRMTFLWGIYQVDEQRSLEFCDSLGVPRNTFTKKVVNYFNSKEEAAILQGGEARKVAKGDLRKQAFRDFPLLFYFHFSDDDIVWDLPIFVKDAIDSGNIWRELSKHYGLSTKTLQKIPFLCNESIIISAIIAMLRNGILKSEWLPHIPKEMNLQLCNPDEALKKLQREQRAFCEVIGGCFRLSKELGVAGSKFSVNNPDTYSEFVTELIKTTAEASFRNWQKTASALPAALRTESWQYSNIRDSVNDFVTTVFLPYCIQRDLKSDMPTYQSGDAKTLLDQIQAPKIKMFLKGVHLSAICELSSHWHELGRAAQLNKAKTFSTKTWDPLFSPVAYQGKSGFVKAIPLTTPAELKKEGEDLKHCVWGYANRCLQENSHVVSFRDEMGQSLSTLEFKMCSGIGICRDPRIINIKGNSHYHLELIQHFGCGNALPPPQCKEVEQMLLDDLREGVVGIDLPGLETKRKERIQRLQKEADILLIGYDPTDEQSFNEAAKIYRHLFNGNIACEKTLRANFDLLINN